MAQIPFTKHNFVGTPWGVWSLHLPFFCQAALIIGNFVPTLSRNFLLLMSPPWVPSLYLIPTLA
jgi:hypothetical protein